MYKREATWENYTKRARLSLYLTPVWCVAAVVLLLTLSVTVVSAVAAFVAVVGVVQLPAQISHYRKAQLHVRSGDADPPDLATLRASLKG